MQEIPTNTVVRVLEIILDVSNLPLHIMCGQGRHRTGGRPIGCFLTSAGVVVGCLRKLQRWNLTSIFEEYRRYAGNKERINFEQFIELFDVSKVKIPPTPPKWL